MATVPKIGYYGEEMNLEVRQGATLGPFLATMTDPDLITPVDLTGCIIRGQIRKTGLSPVVTATLDCAITSALDGEYQFGLSAAVTAAITAGETLTDPKSKYVWDLELEDSAGRITPLYYGAVTILREATRA